MTRLTVSFWLFLSAATVTGGLAGRYLAAAATGHATAASLALTPTLVALFLFSVAVLVRIVRAASRAGATVRAPHAAEDS